MGAPDDNLRAFFSFRTYIFYEMERVMKTFMKWAEETHNLDESLMKMLMPLAAAGAGALGGLAGPQLMKVSPKEMGYKAVGAKSPAAILADQPAAVRGGVGGALGGMAGLLAALKRKKSM
jgi:hypothetical protein